MAHSAGIVPVRKTKNGWLFLILRCYSHWDFPKGGLEPGETPLAAARRECWEESRISELHFKWGYEFQDTNPYTRGKIASYFLAETRQETVELTPNPSTGRAEHDEYRWVGWADAQRMLPPRLSPILDWVAIKMGLARLPAPKKNAEKNIPASPPAFKSGF